MNVSGSGYRDRSYDYDYREEPLPTQREPEPAGLTYCRDGAPSVVKGALCGEREITDAACRTSNSEVDKTLCDDKKMHEAQNTLWDWTKDAVKMVFAAMVGKSK